MYEVDEAAKRITREVMPESNIITGTSIDPSLDGTVRVSVVATGIDEELGQQEATPTNGFARQELGLAPSAAAPVKPTPIAPPAPATNVASKGRGGAFTIGSGTGGVIHTIQGVPGSMEFARAVANPPKPAAEPTPAPQAVEAADAPVMEKPRNPIAPLPETLLTPPARNELMDMREAYNSQSAAQATQHREEVAAAPVSAPVPASAPAPAVAQAAEPAPQPSNLMTAQARAEQARQEPAAPAAPAPVAAPSAPAVAAAEPQLFEPLGGRDDPFAGMEEPARNEGRAEAPSEADQTARPGGALGFLKGLARGGFSKATTAQDVHEAEERERRVRENGFDRLARPAFEPDGPAEPVATRGLNGPGQQPALTSLSTTPTGVDPLDVDESEINIPAFLRRQMN